MSESYRDAAGLGDADDDYYDHDDNNNEFVAKKFHGYATGFDYDDYDEEFNGMRFYDVSEKVRDYWHYTDKYRAAAQGGCTVSVI